MRPNPPREYDGNAFPESVPCSPLSTEEQECKLQSAGTQSWGAMRTVFSGVVLKQVYVSVSWEGVTSLMCPDRFRHAH